MCIKLLTAFAMSALFFLTGCAGNPMRQYDGEMKGTLDLVRKGNVKEALTVLEKNNEPGLIGQEKDLLYFFEKGQLQALDGNYVAARDAWLKADESIRVWEDAVRGDASKILGDIGSYLVNDKVRRYDGQDYEKVMLSTNLMLSHIALGNANDARIEMKKVVERETLIKNFREKEYDSLQEDSRKKSLAVSMKDMKNYPLAELDTPEVSSLKNGYQNAFAHYLAGYFFEVTGELSLAAPGYRNALELLPKSNIVNKSLNNVGKIRVDSSHSDVLFVIESGFAPSWKSVMVPIPVPINNRLVITPLSFPVIKSENRGFVPDVIGTDDKKIPVETLVDLDAMARRQLKDQMPSILLRTMIRAIAKSAAQDQANKTHPLLGIASNVAAVVTEQADDRSWRSLPEKISIARSLLTRGSHVVEFKTPFGITRKTIDVQSPYLVVPIRITDGVVVVGKVNQFAPVQEVLAAKEPAVVQSVVANKKTTANNTVKNTAGKTGK